MKTKGKFWKSKDFRNYRETINRDSRFLKFQLLFGLLILLFIILYTIFHLQVDLA